MQPMLNNLIEQGHRRVKQRIRPLLGFKRFENATVMITGIEVAEKIKTSTLGGRRDHDGTVECGARRLSHRGYLCGDA
jgi:hypothetical protein